MLTAMAQQTVMPYYASRWPDDDLMHISAQITTRDESGALCVQGTKQTSFGSMAADGPPTTLSDTGIDKVAFLQGNLARDATYFLNGTPVGARDLFQARPAL